MVRLSPLGSQEKQEKWCTPWSEHSFFHSDRTIWDVKFGQHLRLSFDSPVWQESFGALKEDSQPFTYFHKGLEETQLHSTQLPRTWTEFFCHLKTQSSLQKKNGTGHGFFWKAWHRSSQLWWMPQTHPSRVGAGMTCILASCPKRPRHRNRSGPNPS